MEAGINYRRLYEYRFRGLDQQARQAVWDEIATHVYALMGSPQCVLDPAAGRGEFISAVPATERWVVDAIAHANLTTVSNIKTVIGDIFEVELPFNYFDGIFVSNFLEHLRSQEEVARFLSKMHDVLHDSGTLAVIGPNFRYCAREYFDCADHTLALTHVAVVEHLYSAGFEIVSIVPRFLPYSFRGILPPSQKLTRIYLRFPPAWKVLGKQFFVLARKTPFTTDIPATASSRRRWGRRPDELK